MKTKVATGAIPLIVILVAGALALNLIGTVSIRDFFGDDGNRRGNRMNLYASSTDENIIVEARVTSSVRGVIYSTEKGRPLETRAPFLQTFLVQNGETLTGVVNAGIRYPGHATVVTCAVTADTGNIEGGHDMYTKEKDTPFPDVHCRGSVTSPPA